MWGVDLGSHGVQTDTNAIKTGGPPSFAEVFTKTAVVVLYFDFIVSKCNFLALYRVLTG